MSIYGTIDYSDDEDPIEIETLKVKTRSRDTDSGTSHYGYMTHSELVALDSPLTLCNLRGMREGFKFQLILANPVDVIGEREGNWLYRVEYYRAVIPDPDNAYQEDRFSLNKNEERITAYMTGYTKEHFEWIFYPIHRDEALYKKHDRLMRDPQGFLNRWESKLNWMWLMRYVS